MKPFGIRPRRSAQRPSLGVEHLDRRDVPAALIYSNDVVGRISEVDVDTGQSRVVANTGLSLQDIAFDGAGRLYGVTGSGQLYGISVESGTVQQLAATGAQLNSLASGPDGRLYAATANGTNGSTLYSFDLTLNQVSVIGQTHGYWSAGDLAFSPSGTLYMTTKSGELVTVNPATAGVIRVGNLPTSDMNGLTFGKDGLLYGLGTASRNVYRIDAGTAQATRLSGMTGAAMGSQGAATKPDARRTFVIFFEGRVEKTTSGLRKLEGYVRSSFGNLVATGVLPWTAATADGLSPLQRGRAYLATALKQVGATDQDRVVLVGHGRGGHLARLLASDIRADLPGSQPASAVITLDPIDWLKTGMTLHQSGLIYDLPAGVSGSRVLNIVQRNPTEKFHGYVINGAINNDVVARGADGVWGTADDTRHTLIDDNLGKDGKPLSVYTAVLQFLDNLIRST